MPRLRQIPRTEVTDERTLRLYDHLFGERDPVAHPGTDTGTRGDWWTVFAGSPDVLRHAAQGFALYRDPARKIDPGELFPWKRLAESGHGLWIEPAPSPGAPLGQGEEGTGVFALQAGLTRLGFDCAPTGKYDEWTTTIVAAFQRHWLQSRFDGVADGETRARLVGLLRAAAD